MKREDIIEPSKILRSIFIQLQQKYWRNGKFDCTSSTSYFYFFFLLKVTTQIFFYQYSLFIFYPNFIVLETGIKQSYIFFPCQVVIQSFFFLVKISLIFVRNSSLLAVYYRVFYTRTFFIQNFLHTYQNAQFCASIYHPRIYNFILLCTLLKAKYFIIVITIKSLLYL